MLSSVSPTTKPNERLQQLLPQLFEADTRSGEAFLRIQVTADTAMALPLDCIEETQLLAPRDITPMPNMPSHILGLMRVKGQVLWLSLLAHQLGLSTEVERAYRYETIVLRIASTDASGSEQWLGLAVQQIRGSIRLDNKRITPIGPMISPELKPFLLGQFRQENETLLILNPTMLAQLQPATASG
jgi:chemotaxis signal transduction protein